MSKLLFHFLNVGKGSCSIVEFPSGRLTVIDVDDSRSLPATMKAFMEIVEKKAKLTNPVDYITGVFENDDIFRFILTHPDMDHMSGINELFSKKSVNNFWDTDNDKSIDPESWSNSPYNKEDWEFYQSIRTSQQSPKKINLYRGSTAECCWVDDGIEILAPTPELVKEANERKDDDYDHLSYVLRVTYKGKKVLLGGDATIAVWEDIIDHYGGSYLKSDVLLAPNHGSPHHMTKDILDVINPDLTVVSVAEGVEYSYDLYKRYGTVLSTKYYGNIYVHITDASEIHFRTQVNTYSDNWYKLSIAGVMNPLESLLRRS